MQVFGIQKDGEYYRVACMSRRRGTIGIDFLDEVDTREGLKSLLQKATDKAPLFVTGIGGQDVLIRHIRTPLKRKSALYKTFPFQLEELLPYSLDDALIQPVHASLSKETQVTFFSVSKKAFQSHVNQFNEEGLDPDWVTCSANALYRFGTFALPDERSYLCMHIGEEETQIVSILDGIVHNSITISIGIRHLFPAYRKDCPKGDDEKQIHAIRQLDLSQLEEKKFPELFSLINRFEREIDRGLCFLVRKEKENHFNKILFAGQGEVSFQIEKWMISRNFFRFSPLKIKGNRGFDPIILKRYAAMIGLALEPLYEDKKSVQFRQGSHVSPRLLARIKKKTLMGISLCLCAGGIAFVFCNGELKKKENAITQRIDQINAAYGKNIPELNAIRRNESLEIKIAHLESKLKVSKGPFNALNPPPLVTDVLAFLCTHPNLQKEGMEIRDLHYELLNYPSIENPTQKYQVKVKLCLHCIDASFAREFHDALVEGESFIDPSQEIGWDRNGEEYEISFFIKI